MILSWWAGPRLRGSADKRRGHGTGTSQRMHQLGAGDCPLPCGVPEESDGVGAVGLGRNERGPDRLSRRHRLDPCRSYLRNSTVCGGKKRIPPGEGRPPIPSGVGCRRRVHLSIGGRNRCSRGIGLHCGWDGAICGCNGVTAIRLARPPEPSAEGCRSQSGGRTPTVCRRSQAPERAKLRRFACSQGRRVMWHSGARNRSHSGPRFGLSASFAGPTGNSDIRDGP